MAHNLNGKSSEWECRALPFNNSQTRPILKARTAFPSDRLNSVVLTTGTERKQRLAGKDLQ